ncbi:hypothetical protein KDK82_2295 [Delftia sp. K82]|uniref:hypothetical protein n=1 Tax=Delftia sp. K82 TaxID=1472718 RepID=UPI000B70B9E6|nr:hypothetical protein [Delftia sp. K82]OWG18815.1 hypothetical protein KDK82_2295 [Delftia sp. K82]
MSIMEFFLLTLLFLAVGFILWKEQQPKTDAEREEAEMRKERIRRLKEIERQKEESRRR